MVPTELLVAAMVRGFTIALTDVVAMVTVLGQRITDTRSEIRGLRTDVDHRFDGVETRMTRIQDEMVTIRASLSAVDARLTTLEQR